MRKKHSGVLVKKMGSLKQRGALTSHAVICPNFHHSLRGHCLSWLHIDGTQRNWTHNWILPVRRLHVKYHGELEKRIEKRENERE